MKTILSLILLLIAQSALAQPFLVCAPTPKASVWMPILSYTITGLGTAPITVPATINTDGSAQLHLDLSTVLKGQPLTNGVYTVTATATNAQGASVASPPFSFSIPYPSVIPPAPGILSLSNN